MKSYPALKMFSWYNINKELDWRVDSSPAVLAAVRKMMSDPFFESDYTDPRPSAAGLPPAAPSRERPGQAGDAA
jgi:hypothetical protein